MSLTYARKMALGAERARYRRRLQEVLDAQGMSGAALARELGITDGSDPMTFTFRYQSAFMAERALVRALEAAGVDIEDFKEKIRDEK